MLRALRLSGRDSTDPGMLPAIMSLVDGFSIETTPKQAEKIDSFRDCLPPGTAVFIALIPGEALGNMVALAERLLAEGMRPVPHIPARSLESVDVFEAYVRALFDAGVRDALILAGGLSQPVGNLSDSMQLLASGLFEELGFEHLYVAGHPEGSPDIDAPSLAAALAFKNDYAARTGIKVTITTQFSFDPERVLDWAKSIELAGNKLPIRIGIAGPASVTALLKYAKMCGVGASMSMLSKAGGRLFQLVGQAAPDGLICQLAKAQLAQPGMIQHLHVYPFGGFVKNARWVSAVGRGEFTLHPQDSGFTVAD